MLIKLKKLLQELSIKDFSNRDTLNDVCFQIQEFLGIKTGDVASIFFSDNKRRSSLLSTEDKYEILVEYVKREISFM